MAPGTRVCPAGESVLIGFVVYFTYGVRRSRVAKRDGDLTTLG